MKAHYENGLYKQLEDTQALLDKMTARLDRIEQEHKEEIARLKEEHRQEVAELKAEIEKRDKRIAELTARNEALTQKDVQRILSSGSCEHKIKICGSLGASMSPATPWICALCR